LFYVSLKNISRTWRRHHCRWRAAKFRPMLNAHGLSLSCDTCCNTRPGFSGLIRRTAPFSRLLSHIKKHKGMWRIYSNPDPTGPHSVTS
jgi:hypothetical protein